MMEGIEKNDGTVKKERDEIFSKAVRAGKRTYFFDVKATRRNDYYLTITESKKRFNQDGRHYFEKHKLFLYKEDFDKFVDNLAEVVAYIRENQPERIDFEDDNNPIPATETNKDSFTDVNFEDLGGEKTED